MGNNMESNGRKNRRQRCMRKEPLRRGTISRSSRSSSKGENLSCRCKRTFSQDHRSLQIACHAPFVLPAHMVTLNNLYSPKFWFFLRLPPAKEASKPTRAYSRASNVHHIVEGSRLSHHHWLCLNGSILVPWTATTRTTLKTATLLVGGNNYYCCQGQFALIQMFRYFFSDVKMGLLAAPSRP